ncbi:MAG: hypothetical protein EXS43_09680 [Opitutus sp.]|nr:hypothetical protein [Opitutus sp.]
MRIHLSRFLGWLGVFVAVGVAAHAEFSAGFAAVDITPPIGWRRAGGYSEVLGTGVKDPLQAKAVVVAQGGTTVAFVGNDLCSVPRELTDRARAAASKKTGIPVANIVITATHTHGGPEFFGPLREVLHARATTENGGIDPREPQDYQARLVESWTEAIVRAQAARKPVTLSVVVPQQPGLAFNRRYLMKDGSVVTNAGYLNPKIFHPAGPTDPDLPFVLVRDGATNLPLGSLTVFAMHTAIHGGPSFSACYPGHLQLELRRLLNAPDFVSVFGEGAAGDVNHIDVSRPARPREEAAEYPSVVGSKLAATLVEALPLARPVRDGQLAMRSVTIKSPVTPLTPADYAAAKQMMETLDRNGAKGLTVVDAWRKMFRHEYWQKHGGFLPQEVQVIRLDRDTAIVTLPHEIFVELGMAIKAGSPFRTTIVVSLANDLDFYIPTRRAFEEGSYEPTTCPLEPGCGELLVDAAVKLLREMKP